MEIKMERVTNIRWLWKRLRPGTGAYAGATVCTGLASGAAMADPLVLAWALDRAVVGRDALAPLWGAGFLLLGAVIRQGLSVAATVWGQRATKRFGLRLRREMVRKAGDLGAEFHDRQPAGETQFHVERDAEQLAEGVYRGLIQVVALGSGVGAAAWAVAHYDPRLLWMAGPMNLALWALKRYWGPRLERDGRAVQELAGAASNGLQEHLASLPVVRGMPGKRGRERMVWRVAAEQVRAEAARRRTELWFGTESGLVMTAGMSGMVAVAGPQLASGEMTAGAFLGVYLCLGQLLAPALARGEFLTRRAQVRTVLARVRGLLEDLVRPEEGGWNKPPV